MSNVKLTAVLSLLLVFAGRCISDEVALEIGSRPHPTNVVFSLSVTNELLGVTLEKIGKLIGAQVINEANWMGGVRGRGLSITNVCLSQACDALFGELPYTLRSEVDSDGRPRVIIGLSLPAPAPVPSLPPVVEQGMSYASFGDRARFKELPPDKVEAFPGYSPAELRTLTRRSTGTNRVEFIPGLTPAEWKERVSRKPVPGEEILPGFTSEELKTKFDANVR